MKYLLYDKHRGPLPSEEQPVEEDLSIMGVVKVIRENGEDLYELFLDAERRVWAKPRAVEVSASERGRS